MPFDSNFNNLPPSMFGFMPHEGPDEGQLQTRFDDAIDTMTSAAQSDNIIYTIRKDMNADGFASEQMDIDVKFQSFMSKELQLREEERERELLEEQLEKFKKLKEQKEQKEYDEKFSKYLDRISERTEEFMLKVEKKKIEDELHSEMMFGKLLDKKDEHTDKFVGKMHELSISELGEMEKANKQATMRSQALH